MTQMISLKDLETYDIGWYQFITVPYGKNIKSAFIVMFLIITTNLVDVCPM